VFCIIFSIFANIMHILHKNIITMIKTKSLEILKTLSKTEFSVFCDFIESPYFNKNSNLVKLTAYLKKFYPSFSSDELTNENLYSELYPGKKYNDNILKNLLSEYYTKCLAFLEAESYNSDTRLKMKKQVSELNRRRLDKFFITSVKQLKNGIEEGSFDSNYFKDIVFVNNETAHYLSVRSRQHEAFINIEEIASSQLFDFLVAHYKTKANLALIGDYYKREGREIKFLKLGEMINDDRLMELIKENYPGEFIFIAPYYYALNAAINFTDNSYFYRLKELVSEHLSKFSYKEKFLMLSTAENVCARKINSGDHSFIRELFDLNIIKLNNGIISYNGSNSFHPSLFRNTCKTAVDLGEITWVKNFIIEYGKLITDDDRDNSLNYCRMLVSLKEKDFENVLSSALKIDLNTAFYKLEVRSSMLISYFELGYFEEALSLLETFKKYLNNSTELSEFQKQTYLNFVSCFVELVQYRLTADKNRLLNAEMIFNTNPSIGLKDWLKEKLR